MNKTYIKLSFFRKIPSLWRTNKRQSKYHLAARKVNDKHFQYRQQKIVEPTTVIFLGVDIVSKLKFDEELKNIIHRTVWGTKILSTMGKRLGEKTKITLLNAI